MMQKRVDGAWGKPGPENQLLSQDRDTKPFFGHLAKARELSRRAVDSASHNGAKETAAIWQGNAALREAEFGNSDAAHSMRKRRWISLPRAIWKSSPQ